MAHRQQYVNDLGNCVFTVHFLTPIFKETVGEEYYNKLTCYGLKSNFEAYPTSMHTVLDDNGNILIHDPNSKINSKQSWNLEDIMSEILNLWSYSY